MGPYKNYADRFRLKISEQLNKAIFQVQIEVKYGFAIYQNLWT